MAVRLANPRQLALLESYQRAVELGQLEGYRQRRWRRAEEFVNWLTPAVLPSLSMQQALALYRASGGNRSGEFKTNAIEEIRDSLDFLLYDTIKLEGRFDECVSDEGAYRLSGAGKGFMSYLLCLRDSTLFAVWNTHAERALRWWGLYPETLKKGPLGIRYLDFLDALQRLRQQLGLADFRLVDEFAYYIREARHDMAGYPASPGG
jgi:hypothetical protein